jgi:hypothetical protein
LSDIVAGGVRVRLLGRLHGKSVYHVVVQTRFQGAFDLAVNINHDLRPEQVREEIQWLVLSGEPGSGRDPLVEEIGGYWPEQDLWSEEFIAGETLSRMLLRLSRLEDHEERLGRLWPFMAWATLSAYVDFWHRSGKRLEIADPDMTNIVVPPQDFLSGVRIVSVSRRRPHAGLPAMLRAFRDEFLVQAEQQYPFLRGLVGWRFCAAPSTVRRRRRATSCTRGWPTTSPTSPRAASCPSGCTSPSNATVAGPDSAWAPRPGPGA